MAYQRIFIRALSLTGLPSLLTIHTSSGKMVSIQPLLPFRISQARPTLRLGLFLLFAHHLVDCHKYCHPDLPFPPL